MNPLRSLALVALSTSLPELATTIVAARRGRTDMVLGTIIGSNIFNLVLILGTAAALSAVPIATSRRFLLLDLPVMLAAAALVLLFVLRRKEVGRVAGTFMTGAYVAYVVFLFSAG